MTFSAARRPQEADGAARRYEAPGPPTGPVCGSLGGKTLAEAIHSHNRSGAASRRVNAMSFSMRAARNFDEIQRDAALMGSRPPPPAAMPVLHGHRRST